MYTIKTAYEEIHDYYSSGKPYGWDEEKKQCNYRTPKGDKCSIGVLLPDGHPSIERNESFDPSFVTEYSLQPLFGEITDEDWDAVQDDNGEWVEGENRNKLVDFLMRVQNLHDTCAVNDEPMEIFIEKLDRLYWEYK